MNTAKVSILIVIKNAEKTIGECLRLIKVQDYKDIDEVLLIDGGSTDRTKEIALASKLPVRIIDGGYPENQEARRSVAIHAAKNEICFFVDSDNYMLDKHLISQMVKPFFEDDKIIATQTLRYAAPKNTTLMNRYFGLFGAGDPIAYYLGKADRLNWAFEKWNLLGNVIQENDEYFTIEFAADAFPTAGCNGIAFKKSVLLKSNWGDAENYFHTDVFVDIARLGYNRFAIVKNEIFHNTAEKFGYFFEKRKKYMQEHYQKLAAKRRYLVFDPQSKTDLFNLVKFVFFAVTIIEPLYESVRGYMKKPDIAWFLHPAICLLLACTYAQAVFAKLLAKK